MTQALQALQERLGYRFGSASLLRQALTHRSHGSTHNERLEFLGDSVLNCAVASLLYQAFGKLDEGDLSRVRANLVKQQALFEIAQRLELSTCLLLGEGEQKSGGFRRPSILADTLEAIFGAIFLDGGFDAAQQAIHRLYEPVLRNVDPNTLGKDAKTLLQEWLQSRKIPLPVYAVVATHGAAHNQLFEVECSVPKLSIQVLGSGGSRRAAEQAAAKLALEQAQAIMPATVRKPRRNARSTAQATAADAVAIPAAETDRPPAAATAPTAPADAAPSDAPAAPPVSGTETQGAPKGADAAAPSSGPIATEAADVRIAPLPARGRANAATAGVTAATAGVGTGPAAPIVPEVPDPAAVPVPAVDPPRRRAHAA